MLSLNVMKSIPFTYLHLDILLSIKYLMVIDYYMLIYKVRNDYKSVHVLSKDMKVDGICIDFC